MAKNKVINTVLTLKDEMSGGLVAAAKAAKKSGKNIDDSMMQATRKVVAFKNKSLTALGDFAKKGVKAAGAAVAGMTAAFIALDGATEEYRVAQGKLNAGFQAAGFSADVARFWAIRTPQPKPRNCSPIWRRTRKRLRSGRVLPQACMARLAIRCQSRD